MQTTRVASITGQFRPGTMRAARASITTETTIFTVAQPIMLTVLVSGEIVESRLGEKQRGTVHVS